MKLARTWRRSGYVTRMTCLRDTQAHFACVAIGDCRGGPQGLGDTHAEQPGVLCGHSEDSD